MISTMGGATMGEEMAELQRAYQDSIKIIGRQEQAIDLLEDDIEEKVEEIESLTNKRMDIQIEYRIKCKRLQAFKKEN